jgi:hypothetical protein
MKSNFHLTEWRGSLTAFPSVVSTAPENELVNVGWAEIVEFLAPACGPLVTPEKASVRYVLPCQLQVAPLVGKTLAGAQRRGDAQVGKQRSKGHVTSAAWIMFDLDGLPEFEFAKAFTVMKSAGVAFAAWTSWSIGATGKSGVHGRVALPLDRSVDRESYGALWQQLNDRIFAGLADRTGGRLEQQQGVWAIGPERAGLAKRWVESGGCVAVPTLTFPTKPHRADATGSKALPAVPENEQVQFDSAIEVIDLVTALNPLAVTVWFGMPSRVRDGEGREAQLVRLGGLLTGMGLPQCLINRIATAYNEAALDPPHDERLVLTKVARSKFAASGIRLASLYGCASGTALEISQQIKVHGPDELWLEIHPLLLYLARFHPQKFDVATLPLPVALPAIQPL